MPTANTTTRPTASGLLRPSILVAALGLVQGALAHAQTPVPFGPAGNSQFTGQTTSGSIYGAQGASSAQQAAPNGMVADQSLVIGDGDLIDVAVFGTPELSTHTRVDQAGFILVPFSGSLHVAGLTAAAAASAVENNLRTAHVMLDPHVTIFVQEYATQGVTIVGEVKAPGTYALFGVHSLYDALAAAGGTTANAGSSITIARRNYSDQTLQIPITSANYSEIERTTNVQPGDTVVVSQAPMIYVVGDVVRPGAFFLPNSQPIKVLNLLALAAGVNITAATTKAAIIRPTKDGGAQTIRVNIKELLESKQPDIVLQAADILVVPRSAGKALFQQFLPNATTAVTSAVTTALVVR